MLWIKVKRKRRRSDSSSQTTAAQQLHQRKSVKAKQSICERHREYSLNFEARTIYISFVLLILVLEAVLRCNSSCCISAAFAMQYAKSASTATQSLVANAHAARCWCYCRCTPYIYNILAAALAAAAAAAVILAMCYWQRVLLLSCSDTVNSDRTANCCTHALQQPDHQHIPQCQMLCMQRASFAAYPHYTLQTLSHSCSIQFRWYHTLINQVLVC
jgi:hypothetical protein